MAGTLAETPRLVPALDDIRRGLERTDAMAERVVDEIVLPALARNYVSSGLKQPTGRLFTGITKRGATGNVVRSQPSAEGAQVTVGVDYAQIPYARWALEGRGPVVARRAKALRFVIDGKVFFRKRVGPAPAHRVYYLETGDEEKAQRTMREVAGLPYGPGGK